MNVTFKDKTLPVRYLQAFLQIEFNNTLRISGIYDEYTHENLLKYLKLPKVLETYPVYELLITTYPALTNEDNFIIEQDTDEIFITSTKITDEVMNVVNSLRDTFADFLNNVGWEIVDFISYEDNSEKVYINVAKENRTNILPKELLGMINQNINHYIPNYKIVGNEIKEQSSEEEEHVLCVIPCEPSKTYYIHVGNGSTNYTIACSSTKITDTISEDFVVLEERQDNKVAPMLYTVSNSAHTIFIDTKVDNDVSDVSDVYVNIWALDTINGIDSDILESSNMFNSAWTINTKFFDYLYGQAITEYSDEMNLTILQEMLVKLYPSAKITIDGTWNTKMKLCIEDYQKKNNIPFCYGYLDAQTESLMLKDIDDRKEYKW
jgi:hypothetical protein